eukprot:jgi/Mesvir1/23427/Mv22287-RA.1
MHCKESELTSLRSAIEEEWALRRRDGDDRSERRLGELPTSRLESVLLSISDSDDNFVGAERSVYGGRSRRQAQMIVLFHVFSCAVDRTMRVVADDRAVSVMNAYLATLPYLDFEFTLKQRAVEFAGLLCDAYVASDTERNGGVPTDFGGVLHCLCEDSILAEYMAETEIYE